MLRPLYFFLCLTAFCLYQSFTVSAQEGFPLFLQKVEGGKELSPDAKAFLQADFPTDIGELDQLYLYGTTVLKTKGSVFYLY